MSTVCFQWLSGVNTFSTSCSQLFEPRVGTPGCPVCLSPLQGAGLVPCEACPEVPGSPANERARFRYRLTISDIPLPNDPAIQQYQTNFPNAYERGTWDLLYLETSEADCTWVSVEKELAIYASEDQPPTASVFLSPIDAWSAACLTGNSVLGDYPIEARPRFQVQTLWVPSVSKVHWVLSIHWRSVAFNRPDLCGVFGRPVVEHILQFHAYSDDCLTPPQAWGPVTAGSPPPPTPYIVYYFDRKNTLASEAPLMRSPWFWRLETSASFISSLYQYISLTAV